MSNQFKAGDLALIVRDDDEYNLGKQVELVEFVQPGESYRAVTGVIMTNASGVAVWACVGDVRTERGLDEPVIHEGFTQKAPYNLMPLRGDFQPEQVRERELVK